MPGNKGSKFKNTILSYTLHIRGIKVRSLLCAHRKRKNDYGNKYVKRSYQLQLIFIIVQAQVFTIKYRIRKVFYPIAQVNIAAVVVQLNIQR